MAKIWQGDLYGKREHKYHVLLENAVADLSTKQLQPSKPHYAWVARDESLLAQYQTGFAVQELFAVNSVGIVTSRDELVIDDNKQSLSSRMQQFFALSPAEVKTTFGVSENKSWTIRSAQAKTKFSSEFIQRIAYRHFDVRYIYKDPEMIERARGDVMRHMLSRESLALIVGRAGQVVGDMPWNVCSITNTASDFNLFYRGGGMFFPLYTYPEVSSLLAEPTARPTSIQLSSSKLPKIWD